jgi:KUP system potassium uptake protein
MGKGFMRLIVRYGFMESPDIPAVLDQCKHLGERFDMMETTFYLSRETIVPSMTRRMTQLRARLFSCSPRTRPAPAISSRFRPTGWSNWVRNW